MSTRFHYIKLLNVICFICFAFFAQNTFGQLPVVKVTIDKTSILIGEQIHYRVQSSMPDNTYKITWFSVADSIGTFVIVAKDKTDTSINSGNINFSQQLILTNFDSGRQVIPSLSLIASDLHSDSSFTIYTDTVPVNVSYSPIDSIQPFHDIKTIIEIKNSWPWWYWAILVSAILLLMFMIFVIIKRLKKKKENVSLFENKLSPFEEAMESFSLLQQEDLVNKNKIKEFHSRLSDIFKRYYSRLTNSYKLHLTTDEILVDLKGYDLPQDQLTAFAAALRMGNAVKFAQYIPPAFENDNSFNSIKEIIVSLNSVELKRKERDI